MKTEIKYIELETGYSDDGPAWIARISMSKTGKTIYFNGMALKSLKGKGVQVNYYDLESGDEYWISGIKKNEWNRHWAGDGEVMIERSLYDWYITSINYLEVGFLKVIDDLPMTDVDRITKIENKPLY